MNEYAKSRYTERQNSGDRRYDDDVKKSFLYIHRLHSGNGAGKEYKFIDYQKDRVHGATCQADAVAAHNKANERVECMLSRQIGLNFALLFLCELITIFLVQPTAVTSPILRSPNFLDFPIMSEPSTPPV